MSRPPLVVVGAAILGISCGHSSPTERGRLCRLYPTAMVVDGSPRDCRLEGATLECEAGSSHWRWKYGSTWDFVLEARAPNRILAKSRSYSWVGTFANQGSGGHVTDYQYDVGSRVVGRRREARWSLSPEKHEYDRTEYDEWDQIGRPVAGTYWVGDQATPVSIWYDDARRTMRSSIGELAVQDPAGNLVREIEIIGGQPWARDYVIEATAEVCIEP